MISRKFSVADPVLQERAGKVIDYLPEDISVFTDFDLDLNEAKVTLLSDVYHQSLQSGTDNTEAGLVKQLTENLSAEITRCVKVYKDVRYFAKKLFSNSPAILKQFGLKDYYKARANQPRMVAFMHEVINVVEKYKNELIEAGMKESVVTELKEAALSLERSNVAQETGKDNRAVKTESRITRLNELYALLLEFSEASKIIFSDDPAKRQRYILPHSQSIGKNQEEDVSPAA